MICRPGKATAMLSTMMAQNLIKLQYDGLRMPALKTHVDAMPVVTDKIICGGKV